MGSSFQIFLPVNIPQQKCEFSFPCVVGMQLEDLVQRCTLGNRLLIIFY